MNNLYKEIINEYEKHRNDAMHNARLRKEEALRTIPELANVEEKINKLGLKYSRQILLMSDKNSEEYAEELLCLIQDLKAKKKSLLRKAGLPEDFCEPQYRCPDCKDTGYIGDVPNQEKCSCLKQHLINIAYCQSNLSSLNYENFDCFDDKVFSAKVDEEKYGTSKSPRENILEIKNKCLQFIDDFEAPGGKSLLFSGGAGVGKTFMSNCIAREVLNMGKTVLYQTAPVLFNHINEYKARCFNNDIPHNNIYKDLFETDLLIIDDLGTETASSAKVTDLFTIINTRILNNAKKSCRTIISTNFGIRELLDVYTDRVVSRIGGAFNLYKFIGEDIRTIKK